MRKLKFEGKFNVGDYIRAYDFEPCKGRLDSYIEGTIVEVHQFDSNVPGDYSYFKVDIEHCVSRGEKIQSASKIFKVPMETTMDYDHRIIEV